MSVMCVCVCVCIDLIDYVTRTPFPPQVRLLATYNLHSLWCVCVCVCVCVCCVCVCVSLCVSISTIKLHIQLS